VLGGTDGGLVNRLIIGFEADVEDHYSAVIAANSDQGWSIGVEIDAHNTCVSRKTVLRPGWIFYCEAANKAGSLLQEIVATVGNSEEILISRVPCHSCYILAARLLSSETPQG